MEKIHWKKLTNPDFIGSWSIDQGKELIVTLEKVTKEMVTGADGKNSECIVASLKGMKPLILNKTNCKTISKLFNSPYIEDWKGKQIALYVEKVRAFGETVDAVRVKSKLPNATVVLPELTESHAKWAAACNSITAGTVTIEQIKKSYLLSPDIEAKLTALINKDEAKEGGSR